MRSVIPPIGVLLVDDQPAMIRGLRMLIDGEYPHMRVVGSAACRKTALLAAAQTRPDVVLLDLDLGGESGLEFLPELLALPAAVLVFTGVRDHGMHARAVRDGAAAVVMKEERADVLLAAIGDAYRSAQHHGGATVAAFDAPTTWPDLPR